MSIYKTWFMRKIISSSVATWLVAFFSVLQLGCFKDTLTKTYTIYTPVYETKAVVLANIKGNSPKAISNPGKIFLYGKYIFLNELNKGVHVIDNTDPSRPVNKTFINIPGNIDIAVKGNTLYADLYTDMLAIDISDPLQAKLVKKIDDIFPERYYGNGFLADTSKIIIDWIKKDTTVMVNISQGNGWPCPTCSFALVQSDNSGGKNNSGAPGIAGSMSRFAIMNDFLYAVNMSNLHTFSISNPMDPIQVKTTPVGWDIETIYPFKGNLFIGSSSGMFIFGVSNPVSPEYQGSVSHFRACDPVVANDKYAYVTLRAGTFCDGTANQLDIIDIQDIRSPQLIKSFEMTHPHGLAIDGSYLFVCDGKDGLKVYDASTPGTIKLLEHIKGMETYDVIAWQKKLLLVTTTGLEQYDYSNINGIKLLSKISLN